MMYCAIGIAYNIIPSKYGIPMGEVGFIRIRPG